MARSLKNLLWCCAALVLAFGHVPDALAQSPSCTVTYTWPTWVGGNGFGANLVITNNGSSITNGWTLTFNFPNGQRLQNGWPVAFAQSASSQSRLPSPSLSRLSSQRFASVLAQPPAAAERQS